MTDPAPSTAAWTIDELAAWDDRIRERVRGFGLDCYEQEFEVCDHAEMIGYMAYHGLPSHYPHWSFGKAYEKQKTMVDHGAAGLPYEMVINADPALAYLMRDNSLTLQVLTIAHVYGHNDFFKNNFTFRTTRARDVLATFKAHADRIRTYVEDPSIGIDRIESLLDAAHALSMQRRRNLAVRKLDVDEERGRLIDAARPPTDPFARIHRRAEVPEPDVDRLPPSPEADLLLFVRDHAANLEDWERDVLGIVDEEACYFLPQIETKIMNEGWATYWHHRILTSLELPQALHLEFLVRHNQVVRAIPGDVNPYHLGFAVWNDVWRRHEHPTPEERDELGLRGGEGDAMLFEVRAADRDASFLRRFLNERLMRELDLLEVGPRGDDLVVQDVSDPVGWERVKETLLRNVGLGTTPVIEIVDARFGGGGTLRMRHAHDGRDLHLPYAERTLAHVARLWGAEVHLETTLEGQGALLIHDEDGFHTQSLA